jgi:hypothetical protein
MPFLAFLKYHLEPILLRVTDSRKGLTQFITRLCGIVGWSISNTTTTLSKFKWLGLKNLIDL